MPEPKDRPRFERDSVANTLLVAIGVSLVCSIFVSATAVVLRPLQERNQVENRQRIVLEVAGLYEADTDVGEQFSKIESRYVTLGNGEESEDPVYLVRDDGTIEQIILPVHGPGLWSTMYGFLSVGSDGRTIRGLRFYEHAETPGLGDQVDKPEWLAQWPGKKLYDDADNTRIRVVRGQASSGEDAVYQVDGMSGATLTGKGVTELIHHWVGPDAFGPVLERLSKEESGDG